MSAQPRKGAEGVVLSAKDHAPRWHSIASGGWRRRRAGRLQCSHAIDSWLRASLPQWLAEAAGAASVRPPWNPVRCPCTCAPIALEHVRPQLRLQPHQGTDAEPREAAWRPATGTLRSCEEEVSLIAPRCPELAHSVPRTWTTAPCDLGQHLASGPSSLTTLWRLRPLPRHRHHRRFHPCHRRCRHLRALRHHLLRSSCS